MQKKVQSRLEIEFVIFAVDIGIWFDTRNPRAVKRGEEEEEEGALKW